MTSEGHGVAIERPVQEVYLDNFYISKVEVTQGQW
jgi:formylglycine-generating enzyme required for sulfatase activity